MSPQTTTSMANDQEPSKKRSGDKAPGQIAFVSFDANSSAASRQAVRKQAALASAATRKATIARKLAERQAHSTETLRTCAPQDSWRRNSNGKGKRSPPCHRSENEECLSEPHPKARLSSDGNRQTHKNEPPVSSTGYLSPHASDSEYDASSHSAAGRYEMLSQPCQGPQCRISSLAATSSPASNPCGPPSISPTSVGRTLAADDSLLPLTPLSLPSPAPTSVSTAKMDPFNCYPVEYYPIYDKLLHHMLTIFAPRGWPALSITRQEGLQWEWFMTQHALAEPSLFLVRLLFASGDMIRLNALGPDVAWWLRSLAIKAINDALSDPERSISDGLILAVGRIALNEALYGDRNASNAMHRPAQRRMIDLRGGMATLPFPPLVKRLMRWADRVMSIQSATERLLPDDEDQGNFTWTVRESVQVLEDWVPSEGKALRKKIAISDLLT